MRRRCCCGIKLNRYPRPLERPQQATLDRPILARCRLRNRHVEPIQGDGYKTIDLHQIDEFSRSANPSLPAIRQTAGRIGQIAGKESPYSSRKPPHLGELHSPLPSLTSRENLSHSREASRADEVFSTHSPFNLRLGPALRSYRGGLGFQHPKQNKP
jgi:hypothetical protein